MGFGGALLSRALKLFWVGLLFYGISFVLLATGGDSAGNGRVPGLLCAIYAFFLPLVEARDKIFHNVPIVLTPASYISLLISGWINPVFGITAFLILTETHRKLTAVLKVSILLMVPFTVVFFIDTPIFHPREGYFLWLIGMILALFSERLAELKT